MHYITAFICALFPCSWTLRSLSPSNKASENGSIYVNFLDLFDIVNHFSIPQSSARHISCASCDVMEWSKRNV